MKLSALLLLLAGCVPDAADVPTVDTELVTRAGYWWYAPAGGDRGDGWRGPDYLEIEHGGWAADWAPITGDAAPPTTYFRHSFWVDDAAAAVEVRLDVRFDDGFVAYVNGEEVARGNLPDGVVGFDTQATDDAIDDFQTFDVPAALLVDGDNQLAIEIHQAGDSGDLAFDASLTAAVATPSPGSTPRPPSGW